MSLKAKRTDMPTGGKFNAPLLDPDNYPGRTVQIIDLGLHRNFFDPDKINHEVMLTYELTTEFMEDDDGNPIADKPRWFSETINMIDLPEGMTYNEILTDQYRGKSKMVLRAKALDPKGKFDFDFSQMANLPCAVEVIQKPKNKKDKTLINAVSGISSPMRGLTIDPLVNPPKVFLLDKPDMEVFSSLPEWLQNKIKDNLEYEGSPLYKLLSGDDSGASDEPDDEEPPFNENDEDENW